MVDYSSFEEREPLSRRHRQSCSRSDERIAYVSLSQAGGSGAVAQILRTTSITQPITFESFGEDGQPIYHTNVMLCLGTDFALVGLELIKDRTQRDAARASLESTGKTVIPLSRDRSRISPATLSNCTVRTGGFSSFQARGCSSNCRTTRHHRAIGGFASA